MMPERDSNGKLPAYAWPGGYPIIYITKDGETLCAACASVADDVEGADVFYEGAPEECAECCTTIESAYGDPEEPDEK